MEQLHRSIGRIDFTYSPRDSGYDGLMLAMSGNIVVACAPMEPGSGEMPSYNLSVNGSVRSVESPDADKPLLYVLRGLGLTATKFGCGLGQCGACTVLADGAAVQSCQITVADAQGKTITTLERLGTAAKPHPIQTAFIENQVPQCGYC